MIDHKFYENISLQNDCMGRFKLVVLNNVQKQQVTYVLCLYLSFSTDVFICITVVPDLNQDRRWYTERCISFPENLSIFRPEIKGGCNQYSRGERIKVN